jgi:hypothetical protein
MRKEIAYFHEDLEAILNEKEFKRVQWLWSDEKNTLKIRQEATKRTSRYRFIKIKSFESSQKINFSTAGTKDFVTTVSKN